MYARTRSDARRYAAQSKDADAMICAPRAKSEMSRCARAKMESVPVMADFSRRVSSEWSPRRGEAALVDAPVMEAVATTRVLKPEMAARITFATQKISIQSESARLRFLLSHAPFAAFSFFFFSLCSICLISSHCSHIDACRPYRHYAHNTDERCQFVYLILRAWRA